jgi:hypothetical protein
MQSVIDRPHAVAARYTALAPWNFSRDFRLGQTPP